MLVMLGFRALLRLQCAAFIMSISVWNVRDAMHDPSCFAIKAWRYPCSINYRELETL